MVQDFNLSRDNGIFAVHEGDGSALYMLDLPLPLPGFDHHLSSWLLRDARGGRNILVDTGPSASVAHLGRSLRSLGVDRLDLILLTHVHADHAGGIADLLELFPEALVLAPEKGVRHLVRPERLEEATRATLGDEIADAFGPIRPAAPDRFLDASSPLLDGITVIPTPGHASHHNSYVLKAVFGGVLFPGEAAGVGLGEAVRPLWLKGGEVPATPAYRFPATPPRLDGAALYRSMELLMPERGAEYLCFSHYGWTEDAAGTLEGAVIQFREWEERARACAVPEEDAAVEALFEEVTREDPQLGLWRYLRPEQRDKEGYFIRNSLRGVVRWVRS